MSRVEKRQRHVKHRLLVIFYLFFNGLENEATRDNLCTQRNTVDERFMPGVRARASPTIEPTNRTDARHAQNCDTPTRAIHNQKKASTTFFLDLLSLGIESYGIQLTPKVLYMSAIKAMTHILLTLLVVGGVVQ